MEHSHKQKDATKTAVIIITVFILASIIASLGYVMVRAELKEYARNRVVTLAEYTLNNIYGQNASPQGKLSLPKTSLKLAYQTFLVDQNDLETLYGDGIKKDVFLQPQIQAFYNEHLAAPKANETDCKFIKCGRNWYITVYVSEIIRNQQYILCGYVSDVFFLADRHIIRILTIYAMISIAMVLFTVSCVGFLLNLNKAQRMSQEEIQKREKIQKQIKTQEEFFASLTHELRTPVSTILGINELIKREHLDKQTQEYTTVIDQASKSLLNMVDEVLNASKIENYKDQVNLGPYFIVDILTEIEQMILPQAKNKGLELQINMNNKIPDVLIGDEYRLKHVLTNLCMNAIKFTKEGSVTLNAEYRDNILHLSVSDTGIGMTEQELATVFDKFARGGANKTKSIDGAGLGLYIVKNYVESMGGTISVQSVLDEGTTFDIRIPQDVCFEELPLLANESFVAPDLKILFIDDTTQNLNIITKILSQTQIQLDTADTSKDAISKMIDNDYDIIIFDARMPDISGYDLFEKVHQMDAIKNAKTVMLTANFSNADREKAKESGFDAYLNKPISANILENLIYQLSDPKKVTKYQQKSKQDQLPTWLIMHPEFDTNIGCANCGEGYDYLQALLSFAKYAPDKANELQELFNAKDITTFTIKIHAVKSIAQTVGAQRLSKIAAKLEIAGDQNDVEYISAHLNNCLKLYHELAGELNARLLQPEGPVQHKNITIERGAIYGIVCHMQKYVQDFNDEAIGSMLKALSAYHIPQEIRENAKNFLSAYERIDWESMEAIINEIAEITKDW